VTRLDADDVPWLARYRIVRDPVRYGGMKGQR